MIQLWFQLYICSIYYLTYNTNYKIYYSTSMVPRTIYTITQVVGTNYGTNYSTKSTIAHAWYQLLHQVQK